MSLKTILTYLPNPKTAPGLLRLATKLARKHDAHLIGLSIVARVPLYGVLAVEIPNDVIEKQRQAMREEVQEVHRLFDKAVEKADCRAEWRSYDAMYSDLAAEVISQAMTADLTILGQEDNDPFDAWADLVPRVVMGCGRPVLVVPSAGTFTDVGKRPMIAWNASREAARAAFDAIPLIADADVVEILAVNPSQRCGQESLSPGEDLAVNLARHGLALEAATSATSELKVGDELLSRLADRGCDLLVMGCYGHSRIRETLFGGATRHLLAHMTVPVLMSH